MLRFGLVVAISFRKSLVLKLEEYHHKIKFQVIFKKYHNFSLVLPFSSATSVKLIAKECHLKKLLWALVFKTEALVIICFLLIWSFEITFIIYIIIFWQYLDTSNKFIFHKTPVHLERSSFFLLIRTKFMFRNLQKLLSKHFWKKNFYLFPFCELAI